MVVLYDVMYGGMGVLVLLLSLGYMDMCMIVDVYVKFGIVKFGVGWICCNMVVVVYS